MHNFYFLLIIFSLAIIPLSELVFAETFDINMPTGSGSPDAPYFWQNEKTGEATGDIEILVGDTIVWKNGDQAKHTITSGTLEDGPDGIFGGTEFLAPGEFYSFTFLEKGYYPYFCLIHPWMIGSVSVTGENNKVIADVGQDAGDGLQSFDVEYQYSGVISDATVNVEQKSITFQLVSNANSLNQNLMLMLPSDLIGGPYVIFVDGEQSLKFDYMPDEVNTIEIELEDNSNEITIVGTKIIPEFGVLAIVVLGASVTSIIFVQKSRIITKF